eukprot:TRINITY_DN7136_c0_g1_i1.p1 TRINITY_DN7136_c0_g1~~TRINITY_DN7136_c0_g1_i1.p1  ORF type:complete len:198 (-),score=62.08 TRINITY_DN7136_c0_g1_i1:197-790(-)
MRLSSSLLVALCVLVVAVTCNACCLPVEWEGEAYGYDHRSNATFHERLAVDEHNRRIRVDVFADVLSTDKKVKLTIYEHYDAKDKLTKIFTYSNGQCTLNKVQVPWKKACVKDGHHHTMDYTIGGHLHATLYFYDKEGQAGYFSVSKEGCNPIQGVFLSHHEKTFTLEDKINYINVRHGIADRAIFELPFSCQQINK